MVTVTTTTPTGKERTAHVATMREAGRIVAYTLADNTGMPRKEATQLAMTAERHGFVAANAYTFRITREHPQ